jgi:phospho-N-acetylmuramoyl-pentapeptide-transferase
MVCVRKGGRALLYWLLYQKLYLYFHVFRIFRYLTFRTAFASLTALLIGLLIGPFVIERLREFQIGQYVREDGPQTHLKKGGTPTMGGVLICISILVPTLLWADLSNPLIWVVMLSTLAFGGIGFADDYIKVVKKRSQGLTARQKLALQFLASGAVGVTMLRLEAHGSYSTRLMVPFAKRYRPDLVWNWMGHIPHMHWLAFLPFVVFVMLVVTLTSNAVNLTDGLDGLAIGCTIIAAGALTVLTYVSGHVVFSDYLELQRMPLVSEVTIFCGSMVGAAIGFLWYNAHPAEVFMGDGRGDHQARTPAAVYWRRVSAGGGQRDSAGGELQAAERQTNFQDGSPAPPLRAAGVERGEGDHAVLDSGAGVFAVRADYAEAEVRLYDC